VTASVKLPHLGSWLHKPLPYWAHWTTAAIGIAFIAIGALVWRRRRASATDGAQWHTQFGGVPPTASAALGLLPALVNPKIVAASVLAGGAIRSLPSPIEAAAGATYYVAVATVTVAAPVLVYLALGSRIDPKLERLRQGPTPPRRSDCDDGHRRRRDHPGLRDFLTGVPMRPAPTAAEISWNVS
jgi:hypothetical protein